MRAQQPQSGPPLYRDPEATVGDRVDDLLARMTLPKKVAQLGCTMLHGLTPARFPEVLGEGMGTLSALNSSFTGDVDADAAALHAVQRYSTTREELPRRCRVGVRTTASEVAHLDKALAGAASIRLAADGRHRLLVVDPAAYGRGRERWRRCASPSMTRSGGGVGPGGRGLRPRRT